MFRKRINNLVKPWLLALEGEGDGSGTTTPPATPPATPKSFTQDEVNAIMAKNRRTLQEENTRLQTQMQELATKATLTEQEREDLNRQFEDFRNQNLTKEQQAEQRFVKLQKDHDKTVKELTDKTTFWQNFYTETRVNGDIISAAAEHAAYKPQQLVALLKPMTRVTEELGDDGKATGNFVTKVKFPGRDTTGKPIVLDLSVSEAVKAMKEDAETYGNLFISGIKSGLGGTNNRINAGDVDVANLPTAEYRKLRKEKRLPFQN